jgi:hypothetical protein
MVPGQQRHLSGSLPKTLRMRSRQSGRISRARHWGGAVMNRIWAGGGEVKAMVTGAMVTGMNGTR